MAGWFDPLSASRFWTPEYGQCASGAAARVRRASYDPTRPASFPRDGRTLTDDAVGAFLAVLTNRKVTGDKVGPHIDLLAEFPYVGPPPDIFVPSHATSPVATELRKASRRLGCS